MPNQDQQNERDGFFANLGYGVLVLIISYEILYALTAWISGTAFGQVDQSTVVLIIDFIISSVVAIFITPLMVKILNLQPLNIFTAFIIWSLVLGVYILIAKSLGLIIFDAQGHTSLLTNIIGVVALIVVIIVTPSFTRRFK